MQLSRNDSEIAKSFQKILKKQGMAFKLAIFQQPNNLTVNDVKRRVKMVNLKENKSLLMLSWFHRKELLLRHLDFMNVGVNRIKRVQLTKYYFLLIQFIIYYYYIIIIIYCHIGQNCY
jgi:hypothetical protein